MKSTLLSLLLIAASGRLLAGGVSTEDFVAHEWGTFTSVQGADGILIPWKPLETSKLPRFVYDWSKPGLDRQATGALNPGSKGAFVTFQRMETPVIYFYSPTERIVNVAVRFPQGLITEWYPQSTEIGPSAFPPGKLATTLDEWARQAGVSSRTSFASLFGKKGVPDSRIGWQHLRILPAKDHPDLSSALPVDSSGNHYFAARETDAAFVRVNPPGRGPSAEQEKFLFYRGVANFKTPLNVILTGANEESFQLRNTSTSELRHLFMLSVKNGAGKFTRLDSLAPNQSITIELTDNVDRSPLAEVATRLGRQVKEALIAEGLFEREAAAMVKTWRDSWFEEEGVRVIYTLPRAWTDETLPLTLEPMPRQVVRVMIGRAEIIPPTTEWELLKQIVRYAEGDPTGRRLAIDRVQGLGLGRFFQPTVHAVLGAHASQEFSHAAWELLDAATKKSSDKNGLAAK